MRTAHTSGMTCRLCYATKNPPPAITRGSCDRSLYSHTQISSGGNVKFDAGNGIIFLFGERRAHNGSIWARDRMIGWGPTWLSHQYSYSMAALCLALINVKRLCHVCVTVSAVLSRSGQADTFPLSREMSNSWRIVEHLLYSFVCLCWIASFANLPIFSSWLTLDVQGVHKWLVGPTTMKIHTSVII